MDNNDELISRISELEESNKNLLNKLNSLEKNTNEILESYNALFNNLFVFHELKPKRLLKNYITITIEILKFIDNICKKHGLKWWLSAGNLLGAVRHDGFIPWDDDCDICFTRKDYEKFLDVAEYEIKNNGLDKYIIMKTCAKINDYLAAFTKIDYWVDGKLLTFIDLFPYDFVKYDDKEYAAKFLEEHYQIYNKLKVGDNRRALINESYTKLDLSNNEGEYLILGIEYAPEFKLHKTDKMFPLKLVKFENELLPCPNDLNYNLEHEYGNDYMKIPKIIINHNMHYRLLTTENANELLEEHINVLKEVNRNFK